MPPPVRNDLGVMMVMMMDAHDFWFHIEVSITGGGKDVNGESQRWSMIIGHLRSVRREKLKIPHMSLWFRGCSFFFLMMNQTFMGLSG